MRICPKALTLATATLITASFITTQAQACSCLAPAEAFDKVENAFVGQVLSKTKCNPEKHGMDMPKSDKGFFGRMTDNMFKSYTCYRVAVVDQLRGELGSRVAVIGKSNPESAACEAEYVVGGHVLFLEDGKGPYKANLCSSFPVGKDAALLKELETKHNASFNIEGVYKTEAPAAE